MSRHPHDEHTSLVDEQQLHDIAKRQAAACLLLDGHYDEREAIVLASKLAAALRRLEPGDRIRRVSSIDDRLGLPQ